MGREAYRTVELTNGNAVPDLPEQLRAIRDGVDDGQVYPGLVGAIGASVALVESGVVDDDMVALDLSPNKAEVGLLRLEDNGAPMVRSGARLERCAVEKQALLFRMGCGMSLAVRTAVETIAAAAVDLVCVGILAAHDAVVLPECRVHAPEVQLVHRLVLFDRDVRDVDLERHCEALLEVSCAKVLMFPRNATGCRRWQTTWERGGRGKKSEVGVPAGKEKLRKP
jgi:hypothetical protein